MIERKIEGLQEGKPTYFSFICPSERFEEVKEYFKKDQNFGELLQDTTPSVRVFADPETKKVTVVKGIEVLGKCLSKNTGYILNLLADRGIAGYSRPTQILYLSQEDIGAQKRIRAEIERYNNELEK